LNDLSLRLGPSRCKWVTYPKGCKDLGDALQNFGVRGVVETIARARWMVIDGVYRMSELPPLVAALPHDTGFPG
jgi:twinkle protein